MSHLRNMYKNRFVSASNPSSASTSTGTGSGRYQSSSSSMNSVPPPPSLTTQSGYQYQDTSYQYTAASTAMTAKEKDKKKEEEYLNLLMYGAKTEKAARTKKIYDDEYLEREDSDEEDRRDSRRSKDRRSEKESKPKEEDDEDDLDAFMAGINEQASKDKEESERKERDRATGKEKVDPKVGTGRADIDEEDMQESYFRFIEEKKEREGQDEEEEYEYDEDGNIIWTWKKVIDPLPPIDHSTITYSNFHKNFYHEHDEIKNMTYREAQQLRETLGLRVGGHSAPRPVCSFAHFGFDKPLMDTIIRSEYEQPTPIQSQAIPAALSGRDVLGIAKTGSGKTAAYLWPAIIHIMDQPDLAEGDGPIAVVVVPTRELAIQVYQEAKRFCKAYNINVICAYGGGSKWEQSNELKDVGSELVVCTPGRIIDLVKMNATNFRRTTFLVFDEADRMFDMGFEAQVKSISDHIRPDRQCLMFSATFKHKVERLARDALQDPVRIVQGEVGEANADVIQHVEVLRDADAKWPWLTERLVKFAAEGKVLIFVTKKLDAERVAQKLTQRDIKLVLLHGDMLQNERNEHLQLFRKSVNVMVATDVAARGLDIPEIRTVVNYDLARDIDTHVHRIGRTGRAGQKGNAFTLLTDKDMEMAGHLVRNLESVNQEVPPNLMSLAMRSAWFRSHREGGGGGGRPAHARPGLGFKPKTRGPPGTGANLDPLKEAAGGRKSLSSITSQAKKSFEASTSGPAAPSNRLDAMKKAFKHSFQSTFHAAQSESSKMPMAMASDPRPEWKRKIDEINAKIASQSQDETSAKKRSRWQ